MTSIHYLFREAIGLDLSITFVGDMPRLLTERGWELNIIDDSELRCGDLLFLKKKSEERLVSHVAIAISAHRLFHCAKGAGACNETVSEVFTVYEQVLRKDLLRYIDIRNTALREEHSGHLLTKE